MPCSVSPHLLFLSVWNSFRLFLASFSGGTAPYCPCIPTLLSFGNVIICLAQLRLNCGMTCVINSFVTREFVHFQYSLGILLDPGAQGAKEKKQARMTHDEVQMK